jgi:hypothetical protein
MSIHIVNRNPKQFADYAALLITLSAVFLEMFCDPHDKE